MTRSSTLGAQALACAVLVLVSLGCGGAAPPHGAQADAIAAVRTARGLGAEATPQASYHLALADDQLDEANALIRQGRMEAARRVLERAKVDADLAIALQREAEVRLHATSTRDEIEDRQRMLDTDGR